MLGEVEIEEPFDGQLYQEYLC